MGTARRKIEAQESHLPSELSNPARRALIAAGYECLEQLAQVSEAEVLALHGVGPKALDPLRRALRARGLSFAAGESNRTVTSRY